MTSKTVSIILYAKDLVQLDAKKEEKYRELALELEKNGYVVQTITWNGHNVDELYTSSKKAEVILIWVNPIHRNIEEGSFENYICDMSDRGKYISSHPEVIKKLGTKIILHTMSGTSWSRDVYKHENFDHLNALKSRLDGQQIRVIKQSRGNDGLEVYKLEKLPDFNYQATEANSGKVIKNLHFEAFIQEVIHKISTENPIIEMRWNNCLTNGVVRCYFCGEKLVGFGYQEVNALYPEITGSYVKKQRFYLTEKCGIFSGLKSEIEKSFMPEILSRTGLSTEQLPLIWDADFFINNLETGDFELCEINASCVSPFPPSAIEYMVHKINQQKN